MSKPVSIQSKATMRLRVIVEYDVMLNVDLARAKRDIKDIIERWGTSYKPVYLSMIKVSSKSDGESGVEVGQ